MVKSQLKLAECLFKKIVKCNAKSTEHFLNNPTNVNYGPALLELEMLSNEVQSNVNGLVTRIVVTSGEGNVLFDTRGMGESGDKANTYANWVGKTISDNHNTRVAFMDAMQSECGKGYEVKTTLNKAKNMTIAESRYAVRVGESNVNHVGVIALSVEEVMSPTVSTPL